MADLKGGAVEGDERAARLLENVEVILTRFESVRPTDALPDHRGVDAVAVTYENALNACRVQVIQKALGGVDGLGRQAG